MDLVRERRTTAPLAVGLLAALGVGIIGVALAASGAGNGNFAVGTHTPAAPRYVEEAAAAGIAHAYEGEFEFFVGGGVTVFDCNSDGRPDAYIAGGSRAASLFRNESPAEGALNFSRLAAEETDLTEVTGAYALDIDRDGHADLAVLRRGENVLLRGLGNCRFERANEAWGFDGGEAWTAAFSARWDEGSDWPTLAFGNYLDPADSQRSRCSPNVLMRPGQAGYGDTEDLAPAWCTLSLLFSDWDRSGRRDLRVSNDRHYYSDQSDGQEQLWRIDQSVEPRLYTRDDGWQPLRLWGMGIAGHDVSGDGYPDYFLTSQGDNKLQTLADGPTAPTYRDMALSLGATSHRPFAGGETLPSTAWHAEFQDVNNDGLMDLFVAKGNVEAQAGHASLDPNNLLLGQRDGTFVEGAQEAGIVHFARTRGAALADFNGDGLLDLLEVNRRENVKLWRNVGRGTAESPLLMGNWLAIRPRQPAPNVDAIGAWVQVRVGDHVIERELVVGGGHAGGQLGPLHFGLGRATSAEVRVSWPDGEHGPWLTLEANQLVEVKR